MAQVARLGAMILPGLSPKRDYQDRDRKRPARQFSAGGGWHGPRFRGHAVCRATWGRTRTDSCSPSALPGIIPYAHASVAMVPGELFPRTPMFIRLSEQDLDGNGSIVSSRAAPKNLSPAAPVLQRPNIFPPPAS